MWRKVETSSSEAKIVRIGVGSFKIFPSRLEKGTDGGKNRAADSNFGEKMASQSRSFETAVSRLDFVYRKLRQTHENPPKTMKLAKWTTEIRQGEFIYLILFKKSNILFHCAILSFVILHSIQCLVDAQILNGLMCNTTPHT